MTAWTDLVKKVYNENKSKPGYKFKNAMKDAAKIYKNGSTGTKTPSKKSRKHRKSRRNRRR
jgi:hypothetical protein